MMNGFIRRVAIRYQFAGALLRLSSGYKNDNRGGIAVIFALLMLPVISLAGAALDLSMVNRAKSRMQHAADISAIAAVSETYLDFMIRMDINVGRAKRAAESEFTKQSRAHNIANLSQTFTVQSSLADTDQVQVRICFEGSYKTTLLSVMNIRTIPFSGCSEAISSKPYYINVYILVDASGSMGIGASESDRSVMEKLYRDWGNAGKAFPLEYIKNLGQCAFYCHTVSPDRNDPNQPDGQPHLSANRSKFKTRFDVVKQALNLALEDMKMNIKFADQFKFNVFKFSNYLTEVVPLTSDINFVKSKIRSMEQDREGAGTNFTYSMNRFAEYINYNGNGRSSRSPKSVVIILSDGIETFMYEKKTCSLLRNIPAVSQWYEGECQTLINQKPYRNIYNGFWDKDLNTTLRNTQKFPPTIDGEHYAWAMDSLSCRKIKEKDPTILVLAAEVYEGDWASAGNANLRQCASDPQYAFTADSSVEVSNAIQQMFGFVSDMPRASYGGFSER